MPVDSIGEFFKACDTGQRQAFLLKRGGSLAFPLDLGEPRSRLCGPAILSVKAALTRFATTSFSRSRSLVASVRLDCPQALFDTKLEFARVDQVVRCLALVQIGVAQPPSLAAHLALPLSYG
jgi:hypothetical protein